MGQEEAAMRVGGGEGGSCILGTITFWIPIQKSANLSEVVYPSTILHVLHYYWCSRMFHNTYLERQMALNGDFLLYRFHFLYL